MLARRLSLVVRLGLWSTALTIVSSPSSAKVIGTMCGRPAASAVASRATRAARNAVRASSAGTRRGTRRAPTPSCAVPSRASPAPDLGAPRLPAFERPLDARSAAGRQPVQDAPHAGLLGALEV